MVIACIILAIIVCVLTLLCIKYSSAAGKEAARSAEEVARLKAECTMATRLLEEVKEAANRQFAEIKSTYERQIAELKGAHEAQLKREHEALGERFKGMAADILQANSKQLDEHSRIAIEAVLAPMKERLEHFTKDFRECYDVENRDRLTLREEIKTLHELNTRVSAETARLTNALKGDTRVQGNWGEMVLKNILEHSGLEEGVWFVTQESTTTKDGSRLRPDAVIHCPGDRDIIIDSKASLSSYLTFLNSDDAEERDRLMKAHVRSVENHIAVLRKKEYQDQVGARKGDFVFMFMPHEGAYLAAMQAKPDLWQNAYNSHVIMVSPTHLVTVVRLVEQMWMSEKQTVNSIKIADEATKLLESLNSFLGDLSTVGDALEKAQKTYDSAIKRLQSGNNNVIRVASRLKELGVKSKKEIPERFSD